MFSIDESNKLSLTIYCVSGWKYGIIISYETLDNALDVPMWFFFELPIGSNSGTTKLGNYWIGSGATILCMKLGICTSIILYYLYKNEQETLEIALYK